MEKQEIIKNIVKLNIDGKLDAYLKKVYEKHDAEITITYKIHQNKQWRYDSKFLFNSDWDLFTYDNKVAFKYVEDLVNHAFTHFKEYLSRKSGVK